MLRIAVLVVLKLMNQPQNLNDQPFAWARWNDLGHVLLLASLMFSAFGWPLVHSIAHFEQAFELMMSLVIASALLVVMGNRPVLLVLLGLGLIIFLADFLSDDASPAMELVATLASLVFSLILIATLLSQVFSETSTVDWRVIVNALTAYLLIGLAFASAYQLLGVGESLPGFVPDGPDGQEFASIYFSFVTLSTLGYGDLTPSTSSMASLAMFEAVTGQLYLAVIVARLVGLHISSGR